MSTPASSANIFAFDPKKSIIEKAFKALGLKGGVDLLASGGTALFATTGAWDRSLASILNRYIFPQVKEINKFAGDSLTTIDKTSDNVDDFFDSVLTTLFGQTSGVSDFTGGIVVGLNGVLSRPTDINAIGNLVSSLIETVSPGSSKQIKDDLNKLGLDRLEKLPDQFFGSLGHVINSIDNLVAVPFIFLSQIYYGAIAIMKQIGKEINELLNSFSEFLFNFLDEIVPVKEVISLLQTVSKLTGQIQGIASIFQGVNAVSGFTLQLQTFSNQIQSALQNPLDTAIGYLPTDINMQFSQVLYTLDNPQDLINQALPPELSQFFAQISKITGYGFNGNMGYGFETVLKGLREGALSTILTNLGGQFSVLSPVLQGLSVNQGVDLSQGGFRPIVYNGTYNQAINIVDREKMPKEQYPKAIPVK
jgi:hypothetical protein